MSGFDCQDCGGQVVCRCDCDETLRDRDARAAMQAMILLAGVSDVKQIAAVFKDAKTIGEGIAAGAFEWADVMAAERDRKREGEG